MHIAFLILAHDKPEQLGALIRALPADAPVFVHFDAWAKPQHWERAKLIIAQLPNVQFVPRHGCRWGSFGIVAATIELVAALVGSRADFDYAALLSGADYPILSNDSIAAYLAAKPGTEFIESFRVDRPNRWSNGTEKYAATMRYNYYHVWWRSRNARLWRRSRGPAGLEIYGGSQWWVLSKHALSHIHHFLSSNPNFIEFYRHSLIPDESFFQTIISNSSFAGRIYGSDLTYADWSRKTPPYPAILKTGDLPALAASGKLFARKFDLSLTPTIFAAIDSDLRYCG